MHLKFSRRANEATSKKKLNCTERGTETLTEEEAEKRKVSGDLSYRLISRKTPGEKKCSLVSQEYEDSRITNKRQHQSTQEKQTITHGGT